MYSLTLNNCEQHWCMTWKQCVHYPVSSLCRQGLLPCTAKYPFCMPRYCKSLVALLSGSKYQQHSKVSACFPQWKQLGSIIVLILAFPSGSNRVAQYGQHLLSSMKAIQWHVHDPVQYGQHLLSSNGQHLPSLMKAIQQHSMANTCFPWWKQFNGAVWPTFAFLDESNSMAQYGQHLLSSMKTIQWYSMASTCFPWWKQFNSTVWPTLAFLDESNHKPCELQLSMRESKQDRKMANQTFVQGMW